MNRLLYAIDQVDTALDAHYYNGIKFIGLAEQVDKLGNIIPAVYKGFGDYDYAGFDDSTGFNIYHRVISVVTDRDEEQGFGANPLKIETYNIRLIGFGNQRDIDDSNVDINYKIADEIETLIPKKFSGVQLTNMDARNVMIDVTGRNHNKRGVFSEELPDTDIKIKPESLLFSIDYNIRIEYIEDCKDLTCDPNPPLVDLNKVTCANFNDATYGLTQAKFDECGLDSFCTVTPPSGFLYQQIPYSQKTSRITEDEKWHRDNGTYNETIPSDPATIQRVDYTATNSSVTLLYNNAFGNKNRLTNDKGGSVYDGSDGSTSGYMIDHLYNRGWYTLTVSQQNTMANAITSVKTLTLGSYSDFRLPSIDEWDTILDAEYNIFITILARFGEAVGSDYWTCSWFDATTFWIINSGTTALRTTTANRYVCGIRNHY